MASTLTELIELAGERFPGISLRTEHLLMAWADNDHRDELASMVGKAGLSLHTFSKALRPLCFQGNGENDSIITLCLTDDKKQPASGIDLLQRLADAPGHFAHKALSTAGLNFDRLAVLLKTAQSEHGGLMAGVGAILQNSHGELERYGRNLTDIAKNGEFDDLCDRPREIEKIVQVMLCHRKRNGVLTGPAGVGKTALVELFARKLVAGELPKALQADTVFEIRMGAIVAGTHYRGDFEQRMENVIKELIARPRTIAFIDEMHLIWGAGRAMDIITDAANLLKPFLARGELQVLGATTVDEYNRYIAQDEALSRRFREIRLDEPDQAMAHHMVAAQVRATAKHHNISITDPLIAQAISLTNQHMKQRRQPDKSVDLIDSAAVRAVRENRNDLMTKDLLNTLSDFTGKAVHDLDSDAKHFLHNLPTRIKARIIGQDQAVAKVCASLIYRRQGLGSPNRCLGTFLFAGDTGVGKTEMAKAIAAEFFENEEALLHIDLAEYNTNFSTTRLLGAPPGYLGHDREGHLIQWLQTFGSGVMLFDEVEKAHPDLQDLLLGLLDNGRVTSSKGKTYDATQCVIILTTNAITSKDVSKGNLGFTVAKRKPDAVELLAGKFPPEFLGRFDEIVLFNPLGEEELRQIIGLRFKEALRRFEKSGLPLDLDEDDVARELMAKMHSGKINAREIARLLEREVLQPAASAALERSCLKDKRHVTPRRK